MINRIAVQSHYLPADAFRLIAEVSQRHPILASVAVLLSFGAVVAILRRRFARGGGDIFAIALFFVAFAVFAAACLYLLATHPGYHIYHPGF